MLFSTSLILIFKTVVVTNRLVSGTFFYQHLQFYAYLCCTELCELITSEIFFSKLFTFVFGVLNFVFLTTSLSTRSLNFYKSAGEVFNLPASKSSTIAFKLFKLAQRLTGLLMSNLSTSAFKAIKWILAA